MNVQVKSVRDQAVEQYEKLAAVAGRESMKAKLAAVNDACTEIVEAGGIPRYNNVMEYIAEKKPSLLIPESTFFNKRPGPDGSPERSPYCQLMDAWAAVSHAMALSKPRKTKGGEVAAAASDFITQDELRTISDQQLRHKVVLMIGQWTALRSQSEMRKAIRENPKAPFLLAMGEPTEAAAHGLDLTNEEVDALEDFLAEGSAKRRGISFNDVGTVEAGRIQPGTKLSRPGFAEALRKIVRSYRGGAFLE